MFFATKFGTLEMVARNSHEGRTVSDQNGLMVSTNVTCNHGIRMFGFGIKIVPNDPNAYVFNVRQNELREERGNQEFLVAVPIQWEGDNPKTRERGKDNVDVVILLPDGQYVDVQCSLVTRGRAFFMVAQQIYQGQVVCTRGEGNSVTWQFAPTHPVNAYPGATYEAVWSTLAESVMQKADMVGASDQKSRARIATWNAPLFPKGDLGKGLHGGVVLYCNGVTGTGRIIDENGVVYFFHFRNIVFDGKPPAIPMLTPMTAVVFRVDNASQPSGDNLPKVKSVRAV